MTAYFSASGQAGDSVGVIQVRGSEAARSERRARMAVEQAEDLDRHPHAAVVAVADRRGEEVVAGLLEARQRAEVADPALHVAVAGLPVVGAGAVGGEHRVGGEKPGGLHVRDEDRAGCRALRSRASSTPILSAKISAPGVVHHPAAVAVTVEAEREVGAARRARTPPCRAASPATRDWGCSAGSSRRARCGAGSTSTPRRARISGAKAPAVPLPVAQTTRSGRLSRVSPTRSAM